MKKKRPISRKDWAADTIRESFCSPPAEWQPHPERFTARVVEVHKGFAFVSPEPRPYKIDISNAWLGTVPRRFLLSKKSTRKLLAVGDRVWCEKKPQEQDLPRCSIIRVAPRQSSLARVDPRSPQNEHIIATNIDRLIIVASFASPPLDFSLIDRYLVLAMRQGIDALIVVNKLDLITPEKITELATHLECYRTLSYGVLVVQANVADYRNQTDVVTLQELFAKKISVCAGHSGVGKSSLINLFSPSILQTVAEQETLSGQHITTYASLLGLQTGGFVIDTPGIKRFALGNIPANELGGYFTEFNHFSSECRYRSCLHDKEPRCKVRGAVVDKKICYHRYASYLGMLHDM